MSNKVLILTGRSLFTEGVISKLRNSPLKESFEVVDMGQPDPLQIILKTKPDFLIVDETDPEFSTQLRNTLFASIPHLKVIFLDPKTTLLRVFQWEEYDNSQIWDLLNKVDTTDSLQQKPFTTSRIQNDAMC